MKKLNKYILILVLLPFVFGGCDSLFDKGDVEKTYEGPDTIGFKPLNIEVDEGDSQAIEVQLISANGVADSDLSVSFSVDGESTASTDNYDIPTNSVTISQGEASTTFVVDFPEDSGLDEGDEVTLILTLDSGSGYEVGEEISTTTIFIQGVDDTP